MERVRISSLKIGQVFTMPIFSITGQKLLGAGVNLSEQHIEAMRRCGDLEVLLAGDFKDLVTAGIIERVDRSGLRVGQRSEEALMTAAGQVLLEPGEEIEAHHLEALAAGGAAFVAQTKAQQQRRERILMSDALVETLEARIPTLCLRVTPEAACDWIEPGDPREWPVPDQLNGWRSGQVNLLRGHYARIEAGLPVPIAQVDEIVSELLRRLALFPNRFTQLALLCPRREDYLPDHAYTVAVLSMGIATRLGWPLDDIQQIGRAGLLYDLGMLLVPERIRIGACELTDIDRGRVQRHPVFSLAMLQAVEGVPAIIQLAALQHHERENGTGYPRGTRREALCDYAKVLGVADSFAAITEPRHYRKPKLPYIAMEETLRSTTAMALWKPAVRGLLQAAGLFPVGSFVKLSNGKNAHVIAANPRQLDRPVIQVLSPEGQADGSPLDLATVAVEELSVVRPIYGHGG